MNLECETLTDRLAINRENSRKSTGPKTAAGKQKSSLNAIRHGLTGQIVVLPSEDLEAYNAFTQRFYDDLAPRGVIETHLVQSLADDSWRLNRAKAMENNLYALGLHDKSDSILTQNDQVRGALAMAASLGDQTKALATLSLHQTRIARAFDKNLKQLREIQAERRLKEEDDMRIAARLYQLHVRENKTTVAYDPAVDGFVFTTAQIEMHLARKQRVDRSFGPDKRHRASA